MLGAFDEHVQHLIGDIFNLVALDLVDEPVEDLLLDRQVTCTITINNWMWLQ